ncbi:hypothetical protein F5883DRAFT_664041 [Diaporthe sp. PMI_573]|nr:hypothetical protein F5883DRAFT_722660 [Diaporthaceae sp. PMI_573]KAH8743544.1 hypothetical protein F5883DRAFT_664041 [Diaporthaceae sp. PMI_573]
MTEFQQQLEELKHELAVLKSRVNQESARYLSIQGARLPEPPKLTDLKNYHVWRLYMDAKIKIDKNAITKNEADPELREMIVFFYTLCHIGLNVQEQVSPALDLADVTRTFNYTDLLNYIGHNLATSYDEEGFQDDARGPEMASDEQFADFLSRFERMAANKAWTDEMKILNLRRGLRNTPIEEMLDFQLKLPATYPDFVKACYELSSRGRRRFKRSESDENKEDDVSDMSETPGGGDPDEEEAVGEEYESGSE